MLRIERVEAAAAVLDRIGPVERDALPGFDRGPLEPVGGKPLYRVAVDCGYLGGGIVCTGHVISFKSEPCVTKKPHHMVGMAECRKRVLPGVT